MEEYLKFAISHWELSLALIATLLLLGWNIFGARIRGIEIISPEQAIRIINDHNPLVVDVREDKEIVDGTLPNSTHIALSKLTGDSIRALKADTSRPVVAACKSGSRSMFACSKFKKSGYDKVYNIKGGVAAWRQAGLPLNKNKSEKKPKKRKKQS